MERAARTTGAHAARESGDAGVPSGEPAAEPGRDRTGLPIPWQALDGLGLVLRLPHDSNSAAALRHSVGGLAFALGLGKAIVADVRQALTEVSGALLHSAADSDDGYLEVDVRVRGSRLEARLLDRGAAMPALPQHRLSLALVAALSDTVKVRRPPEGGVEILVSFDLGSGRPPARDAQRS